MKLKKLKSDRSLRAKLRSPRRPPVLHRAQRCPFWKAIAQEHQRGRGRHPGRRPLRARVVERGVGAGRPAAAGDARREWPRRRARQSFAWASRDRDGLKLAIRPARCLQRMQHVHSVAIGVRLGHARQSNVLRQHSSAREHLDSCRHASRVASPAPRHQLPCRTVSRPRALQSSGSRPQH